MRLLLIAIPILFFSCKKACFQKTGNEVSDQIVIEDYTELEIHDRIEVELVNDSSSYIRIIGNEAFIPNIAYSFKDGRLIIELDQSCGILNQTSQIPKVELSLPFLNYIYFAGTEELYSETTLERDSLEIECWNSSANIDLNISVDKLTLANHIGASDIYLSGRADLSYIYSGDIGFLFLQDLKANGLYLNHESYGEVHVSASHTLEAELKKSGTLVYYGTPQFTQISNEFGGTVTQVTN